MKARDTLLETREHPKNKCKQYHGATNKNTPLTFGGYSGGLLVQVNAEDKFFIRKIN